MSVTKFRKRRDVATPVGLVDVLDEDVGRLGVDRMVVILRDKDGTFRSYWTEMHLSELAGMVTFMQAHVMQEISEQANWVPPDA